MEEKKGVLKIVDLTKSSSRPDVHKRNDSNFKILKAKVTMKKVGRSRTQKGHKNY